jgi:hypothetical protein
VTLSDNVRMRVGTTRLGAVESELAQEKAGALHRAGERLDRALQALRSFDSGMPAGETAAPRTEADRAELVAEAAEALWFYVVQREACGLRDSEGVIRELQVPREVQLRMGVRRKPT